MAIAIMIIHVHAMILPLTQVLSIEGVLSYRGEHFWRHSSNVVCGTLHVQVQPQVSEAKVIQQVNDLMA